MLHIVCWNLQIERALSAACFTPPETGFTMLLQISAHRKMPPFRMAFFV